MIKVDQKILEYLDCVRKNESIYLNRTNNILLIKYIFEK